MGKPERGVLQQFRHGSGRPEKVAVVGAGLAGCMCGFLLRRLGYDVTIYEATGRVGGRCKDIVRKAQGRIVNAGGEILGLDDHPLLEMLGHFDLGVVPFTDPEVYAALGQAYPTVLDGAVIPDDSPMWAEVELVRHLMTSDAAKCRFPDMPWLETDPEVVAWDTTSIAARLDTWTAGSPTLVATYTDTWSAETPAVVTGFTGIGPLARKYLDYKFSNDQCAPLTQLSYLGLMSKIAAAGENRPRYFETFECLRLLDGAQALARKLTEGVKVEYDTPIRSIAYGDDDIVFTYEKGARVETARADYLIMTAPSATWDAVTFTNITDLDAYRMPSGPVSKVVFEVKTRFWGPLGLNGAGTTLQGQGPPGRNPGGQLWEATEAQVTFQDDHQDIYLSIFSGGPNVGDVPDLTDVVDNVYSGRLRPSLVTTHADTYRQEPFIKSRYTYAPLGATAIYRNLHYALPQYNDRFIFAGDGSSAEAGAFMNGAISSAIRAVNQLGLNPDVPPKPRP